MVLSIDHSKYLSIVLSIFLSISVYISIVLSIYIFYRSFFSMNHSIHHSIVPSIYHSIYCSVCLPVILSIYTIVYHRNIFRFLHVCCFWCLTPTPPVCRAPRCWVWWKLSQWRFGAGMADQVWQNTLRLHANHVGLICTITRHKLHVTRKVFLSRLILCHATSKYRLSVKSNWQENEGGGLHMR